MNTILIIYGIIAFLVYFLAKAENRINGGKWSRLDRLCTIVIALIPIMNIYGLTLLILDIFHIEIKFGPNWDKPAKW